MITLVPERYKVEAYFSEPTFCGIQFNRTLHYEIVDTYSDDHETIRASKDKDTMEELCTWLNESEVLPLYKVFKNELNKYFVGYKRPDQYFGPYNIGNVYYNKIEIYHSHKDIEVSEHNSLSTCLRPVAYITSCNFFSSEVLNDGVDSLDEACKMLITIQEKHDELEKKHKEKIDLLKKRSRFEPVECV